MSLLCLVKKVWDLKNKTGQMVTQPLLFYFILFYFILMFFVCNESKKSLTLWQALIYDHFSGEM